MKLTVVVPAYNEAASLPALLDDIQAACAEMDDLQSETLVVDDGSGDDTWQVLQDRAERDDRVRGIRLTRNFGKEAALYCGLSQSDADLVITLDADGQHPPALIPEMVNRWRQGGVSIVSARKDRRQVEAAHRNLLARAYYRLFRRLTGIDIQHGTDYKLLDRRALDAWLRLPERARFYRGLVSWTGFAEATLDFTPAERSSGSSQWKLSGLFRYGTRSLASFSNLPLQLVLWVGALTLVVSVLLGLHTLYNKFSGQAEPGFTTVIIVVLFIGSLIMLSLGVIGYYLARLFEEVKSRPVYLEAERTRDGQ